MRKLPFHIALAFAAWLAAGSGMAANSAAQGETRPVIVELFTSQGCSSCPPADTYLRDLAREKGILPLSFNVDYWDYLGWRDTLANPDNTERQRAYGRALGLSGIYTPQMVVDGIAEGVGSDRRKIDALIESRQPESNDVAMSLTAKDGRLILDIGKGTPPAKPVTIWLIRYAERKTVEIERGENRGKTLTYANVVRGITPIGMWSGKSLSISLPEEDIMPGKDIRCVVLLQEEGPGRILGAAVPDMGTPD